MMYPPLSASCIIGLNIAFASVCILHTDAFFYLIIVEKSSVTIKHFPDLDSKLFFGKWFR